MNAFHLPALLLAALLAGCAASPTTAPDASVARWKRIGVLSVAGGEIHRRYTGFTVFGNEHEKHDAREWELDERYEESLQAALSDSTRLAVVPIGSQYRALPGRAASPSEQRVASSASLKADLVQLAARNDLDAVVVLETRDSRDIYTSSNQRLLGAGVYARGVGDLTAISVAHLIASLVVVDGQTGAPVASVPLSGDANSDTFPPTTTAPKEWSRSPFTGLSAGARNQIRDTLRTIAQRAWKPSVERLFKGSPAR